MAKHDPHRINPSSVFDADTVRGDLFTTRQIDELTLARVCALSQPDADHEVSTQEMDQSALEALLKPQATPTEPHWQEPDWQELYWQEPAQDLGLYMVIALVLVMTTLSYVMISLSL